MHRSGTSLLMNLFERLGFHLGGNDDFHPATAHDPEGYREHIAVWGLNEKILAAGDAAWDEPQRFTVGGIAPGLRRGFVGNAREILQRLIQAAGGRPVAIKDPRLSLTLPLWREALPASVDARFVVLTREPLEVARSLAARDRMPLEVGLALWEAYHRTAFAAVEAASTALLSHRALLDDPARCAQELFAAFDDRAPSQVDLSGLIHPALRRQSAAAEDSRGWQWPGLREVVEATSSAAIRTDLPPLGATLSAPSWAFLERYAADRRAQRSQASRVSEVSAWNEKLTAEIATARVEAVDRAQESAALRRRDAEISAWNDTLTVELERTKVEIEAARVEIEAKRVEIEALRVEIEAKRVEVHRSRTEIESLSSDLAGAREHLARSESDLEARGAEVARLAQALREARLALQNAGGGLAHGESVLAGAEEAVAALLRSPRLRWSETSLRWLLGASSALSKVSQQQTVDMPRGRERLAAEQRGTAAALAAVDRTLRDLPPA